MRISTQNNEEPKKLYSIYMYQDRSLPGCIFRIFTSPNIGSQAFAFREFVLTLDLFLTS